jgi:hypothetical protein
MADDNKPLKYARYAIGEILLVVIGILIALSINNWNEHQKLLQGEKKLLSEVKLGLESDYILITSCINDHKMFLNSGKIIINWIEGKHEFNDSLNQHFKYTFWTALFLPKDAPFESIKKFGFENITNDQLSKQISSLYDNIYEETIFWQNEYKKTSIDYRNTLANIGFEFINSTDEMVSDVKPIDASSLQSNSAYLFNLKMTRGTLRIYTNEKLIKTKEEIGKTIKMIEKELNNR